MSDDLLERAARALADTDPAPRDQIDATRTRIMAALHHERRRRTTIVSFLLPIAAVLVGSTAWAAANGRLPALSAIFRGEATPAARVLPRSNAPHPTTRAPSPVAMPTSAAALTQAVETRAPSPIETPAPTATAAAPRIEAPAPGRADAGAPAAPSVLPATTTSPTQTTAPRLAGPDDGDDLYRAAHQAHFVAHDPVKALAAWDAYLAVAPRGRFVPEARYNRGLALVRLGRMAEARAALEPFARGAYGTYRSDEAQRLLDGLSPRETQ
ncbi:MAG: tetratricopeptide repeat protein [Sorangiineae bacterium]|nr:tetratricopeptide repeat protein [Polyangiaceae bacterium]MEB2320986.1 tetratricopeptide repeat protein [Sorangiineae bacterium]